MSWTNCCWRIGQPLSVAQEQPQMFGRELRTKLPELRPNKSVLDEGIRDRDWRRKLTGKMPADKQRHAAEKPVAPGDTVLVRITKLAES